jgi:hypothetical protein
LTFFEAWYATLAYALQVYFDFSGYSGIMYQPPLRQTHGNASAAPHD